MRITLIILSCSLILAMGCSTPRNGNKVPTKRFSSNSINAKVSAAHKVSDTRDPDPFSNPVNADTQFQFSVLRDVQIVKPDKKTKISLKCDSDNITFKDEFEFLMKLSYFKWPDTYLKYNDHLYCRDMDGINDILFQMKGEATAPTSIPRLLEDVIVVLFGASWEFRVLTDPDEIQTTVKNIYKWHQDMKESQCLNEVRVPDSIMLGDKMISDFYIIDRDLNIFNLVAVYNTKTNTLGINEFGYACYPITQIYE